MIWTLRGNEKAASAIEREENRVVSVLSCMELFHGARNKREMAAIREFLLSFEVFPLSEEIGYRAGFLEQHSLKRNLTPVDALIAATAVEQRQTLCMGNTKHYRPIAELEIQTFRP